LSSCVSEILDIAVAYNPYVGGCLLADVSPHLVFKNGMTPTLWPQDVPYPPEEAAKDEVASEFGSPDGGGNSQQSGEPGRCFSNASANAGGDVQYSAYFKDAKGIQHSVFGGNFSALQYLKQPGSLLGGQNGKEGGAGRLPDVIQSGRSAGMPLYVRCPICQKEFKQKTTLLQHGCIHIESRPYPCPECGKRFRQQSHLTQHLRIHTNEKPYGCAYCGRNFRQRTILNQHLRIHTGEKPYKCGQCGKDFRQKAILDQHARTHQGERPFCCPMPNCRRRFSTENEVKKHIDNHMNPHASKSRKLVNGLMTDSKDRGPTLLPMARVGPGIVKHELYFPQCYAPSFTTNQVSQNQFTVTTGDFKPTIIGAAQQAVVSSGNGGPTQAVAVQTTVTVPTSNQGPPPNNLTSQ
jgi:myeloid zinc finger protein 1